MAIKFLYKRPYRKVVRQMPNSVFPHRVKPLGDEKPKEEEKIVENVEVKANEDVIEENKETKTDKDMADERLEKIEEIMGTKAPKRTVKHDKRDKGLIERTENSVVLLTEDNKMVLTD